MVSKTEKKHNPSPKIDYEQHWNEAYQQNKTEKLGWYEKESTPTLQLIKATRLSKDAVILNVGVGSSTIIDTLVFQNYTNIIANDISSKAIESLKTRLQKDVSKVTFIIDDLTNPSKLNSLQEIDIWNDRAVLHFFLSASQKTSYFNLLKKLVKKGGFVVLAVFSDKGAKKCCGFKIQQYNAETLSDFLGNDFELQQTFNHTFVNPNGDNRPYVYTLFKRVEK